MKNLEAVRNSIIEAAEKHFSLLGFEKTTLDDIAGANGKSKTSVYYHFKNKHDIFRSVIEKEFAAVRADLTAAMANEGVSLADGMKTYLRTRMRSLRKQGAYRMFASSRLAFGENPVSKAVAEARSQFDAWERKFLEQNVISSRDSGGTARDLPAGEFATTLSNLLKALEYRSLSARDNDEVADTCDGMIDLILR